MVNSIPHGTTDAITYPFGNISSGYFMSRIGVWRSNVRCLILTAWKFQYTNDFLFWLNSCRERIILRNIFKYVQVSTLIVMLQTPDHHNGTTTTKCNCRISVVYFQHRFLYIYIYIYRCIYVVNGTYTFQLTLSHAYKIHTFIIPSGEIIEPTNDIWPQEYFPSFVQKWYIDPYSGPTLPPKVCKVASGAIRYGLSILPRISLLNYVSSLT